MIASRSPAIRVLREPHSHHTGKNHDGPRRFLHGAKSGRPVGPTFGNFQINRCSADKMRWCFMERGKWSKQGRPFLGLLPHAFRNGTPGP